MTEEEKYYSLNKDKIEESILENSKGLVYDYKYDEWKEFVKHKKDNPIILKLISFAVRIAYLEKNSEITDNEIERYKQFFSAEKTNISIILNSYFEEDLAYSTIQDIENKKMNSNGYKNI